MLRADQVPLPYVDCVIKHQSGAVRIGRLNGSRSHWQLSTYHVCGTKYQYVWMFHEVIAWREIDLDLPDGTREVKPA